MFGCLFIVDYKSCKYVVVIRLFTELPFLSAHRTVLLHLLSSQPLHDTVHVETVLTMTSHWREKGERERERKYDCTFVCVKTVGHTIRPWLVIDRHG